VNKRIQFEIFKKSYVKILDRGGYKIVSKRLTFISVKAEVHREI